MTIVKSTSGRILIITSVEAEKEAILRGIGDTDGIHVEVAGVGMTVAAIKTVSALAKKPYDLVINAGIAGGFSGKASVGSIAIATEMVAADLGAETSEGFRSIEQLSLGVSRVLADKQVVLKVTEALGSAGFEVHAGPLLTVSTVTGTSTTAEELAVRNPGAVAEAMEGFGVALAAENAHIPVVELRAISNMVGPRDRESWRIKEALAALESASSVLAEVLL